MSDLPACLLSPEREMFVDVLGVKLKRTGPLSDQAKETHDQQEAWWDRLAQEIDGQHIKLNRLGTAGNYSLGRPPGLEFGKTYRALRTLQGFSAGRIDEGEIVRYLGTGCLPYDSINEFYFERLSGASFSLFFQPYMPRVGEAEANGLKPEQQLTLQAQIDARPAAYRGVCAGLEPVELADEREVVLRATADLLRDIRKTQGLVHHY